MAIALKTPVDPGDAPPMLSPVFMDDQSVQGGQQQQLARLPFMNSGPDVVQPSPTQQLINSDQARLEKVRMAQARPYGFEGAGPSAEFPEGLAPNHPGKLGHVLHALSVAGNIAGNIVNPNAMALIPQTQLGMKAEEAGLTNRIGKEAEEESQNQERGAQTAKAQEETKEAPKKLASELGLQGAKEENLESPNFQHIETDQGIFALNPKTHELIPLTYQGQPLKSPTKPVAPKGTEHVNLTGPDGKPIAASYSPDTGKYTDASGKEIPNPVPYEKPQVTNINGAHEFAENERGRGLLDKAEGAYRTAQQGANGLRAMVDNASTGDKMSARMLPLEGALEITTSQGVHRINRTEVDQYAGGGNAFDRLAGMLKGGVTGVPFTQPILDSMKHLADIQEKGAYQNYKGAFDSATKRYGLGDEKALPPPSDTQGGAPEGASQEVWVKGKLAGHVVGNKYVPLSGANAK